MSAAVDQVIQQVKDASSLDDSVLAYLAGVPQLIADAVAKALANGATAEELAPLTDLGNELKGKTDAVKAALIAGTPVSAQMAKQKK